ncbi:hypothetical protein ACWIGX_20095 [Streptomyces nigrescens]
MWGARPEGLVRQLLRTSTYGGDFVLTVHNAYGHKTNEYVLIPALGERRLYKWESKPTITQPFVDLPSLHGIACRLTGWPSSAQS